MKKRGYKLGIISSGPSDLAERVKKECNIDYYFTNKLLIKDDKVVGSRDIKYWPIRHGSKRDPLKEICKMSGVSLEEVLVVVHEDNDIEMAEEAGLAIAFYPTSKELEKHCSFIIKEGKQDLREILNFIH